jgi:3-oxoacyl-[acyl-carrier protein] reductase
MKLENKVVIVTGAVGGIGGEIVKRFVAEGARVLAVDLDQAKVEALADTSWSKRQSIISVRWT